ncbi:unnamed protein product, partial [Thelazia callipaeda]|uniref:Mediator of RNA polymerase II transcription subunit 10 n=1 Tax=Thelazia callipaeda TaxID=103827 RepID=A0A0N5CX07_THECL
LFTLLQAFDKCFTDFFERFIVSEVPITSNPCSRLHETYRQCIEKNLENSRLYDIDLSELRKDVLNTEDDLLRDSQSSDDRLPIALPILMVFVVVILVQSFYLRINDCHGYLSVSVINSGHFHKQCKVKINIMDSSSIGSIQNAAVLHETAAETRFNQLEQTIENFQENARQLGVIASDFSTRSQEPLNQKIHTLVSGLHELDHLKNQFMDVKIPLELLECLDQGKNPQLYTKECLERTLNKNKEMNGKVEVYKKFRAILLRELGEEIPNDMILYRNLRDRKENSPHENYNEVTSD